MRRIGCCLLFFLGVFTAPAAAQDGRAFTIEGDLTPLAAQFETGDDSLSMVIQSGFEDDEPVALDGLRFHYTGTAEGRYPEMETLLLRNESRRGETVAAIPFFREPGAVRVWCRALPDEGFYQVEVTGTPSNELIYGRIDRHTDLNYEMRALADDTTRAYEQIDSMLMQKLAEQDSLMRYWYRDTRATPLGPVMAIQSYYSSNAYRELAGELAWLAERFPEHPNLGDLESIWRRMPGIQPGDTLPDVTLPDRAGRPVRLSDLMEEGSYLLIDCWSSVNGASLSDFRRLKRLPRTYAGRPLTVVGISVDRSQSVWRRTLRRRRPTGIQLWDATGEALQAFHLSVYPTRLLVGPDGTVLQKGDFIVPDPLPERKDTP